MAFRSPLKKRVAGASPGGMEGSSAPAASPAPGYVNFSRLLAANRPGAQAMGERLAGQVQQQGQQAQQDIKAGEKKFGEQVQAGTLYHQPMGSLNRGASMAAGGGYGNPYFQAGQQAGAGRTGYMGPKDWAGAGIDVQQLTTQAQRAGDAARNLTTQGGRGAMLREQARGGAYSPGMSAMDAALSGAALGTRDDELAAQYGNLSQQLAQAQAAGGKRVGEATTASAEAVKRTEEEAAAWSRPPPPPAALPPPTSLPPPSVDGVTWDWNGSEWVPIYP